MADYEFDRLLAGDDPQQDSDLSADEEVSLLVIYGTTRKALQVIAAELKMTEQEVVAEALAKLLQDVTDAG